MKEFSAASAYSIETIQGNTIISKSGDLSVVYELIEPECYSLSEEDMQFQFTHPGRGATVWCKVAYYGADKQA